MSSPAWLRKGSPGWLQAAAEKAKGSFKSLGQRRRPNNTAVQWAVAKPKLAAEDINDLNRQLRKALALQIYRPYRHRPKKKKEYNTVSVPSLRRHVVLASQRPSVPFPLPLVRERFGAIGVVLELRVPDVDDQDEPRLARVVPHLVLEAVIEEQHLALVPAARRLIATSDATDCRVGGRDDKPQMRAQSAVGGPAVRLERRPRAKERKVGGAERAGDGVTFKPAR